MNLKVIQWLLRYKNELIEVVNIAKKFRPDMPLAEKWTLIDAIAKVVIPIVENETKALALLEDTETAVSALALEGDLQALSVDWQLIVDVLLPILINILQALATKK